MPGEKNGMADSLSREEHKRKESESSDGLQSGVGGCGGTPPQSCAYAGNLTEGVPGTKTNSTLELEATCN